MSRGPTEKPETLGGKIRHARRMVDAAYPGINSFAEALGVNVKTLENWEADLEVPTFRELGRIAAFSNVSIEWLIERPLTEIERLRRRVRNQRRELARLNRQIRLWEEGFSRGVRTKFQFAELAKSLERKLDELERGEG